MWIVFRLLGITVIIISRLYLSEKNVNWLSRERKFPGAKVPENFRSKERKFPGTFAPGSESSQWELSLRGAKIQRSEKSWYHVKCVTSRVTCDSGLLRYNVSYYLYLMTPSEPIKYWMTYAQITDLNLSPSFG